MNQSAILAASLLAGFGLFIASRDRLPVYARILWGDKPESHNETSESAEGQEETLSFGDAFKPFGYLDALPGLPEFPDFNWSLDN